MLNTPILLVVFNRPAETEITFNAVRAAKPKKLYVAADAPRQGNSTDEANCRLVRAIVSKIDWDCDAKFLFRDKNVGCKDGVPSGIDWLFENEESGIILEDDCLPDMSFFPFCEELLNKYKNDTRVMAISGRNPVGENNIPSSYFFSRTFKEWGWASWRRAWQLHDIEKGYFDAAVAEAFFERVFDDPAMARYLHNVNRSVHYSGHVAWDYQWQFNIMAHNGLVIVPSKNMITNIGLNSGTHFNQHSNVNRDVFGINTYSTSFPLKHPSLIFPDMRFDKACFYKIHPYLLPKVPTFNEKLADAIKYRLKKVLGK